MALGLAFLWGYLWAWSHYSEATTVAQLENEIRVLRAHIAAQGQDAALLIESKQKISELNLKIQEMQNALSEKSRVCFDAADTERLRNLWPKPAPSSK